MNRGALGGAYEPRAARRLGAAQDREQRFAVLLDLGFADAGHALQAREAVGSVADERVDVAIGQHDIARHAGALGLVGPPAAKRVVEIALGGVVVERGHDLGGWGRFERGRFERGRRRGGDIHGMRPASHDAQHVREFVGDEYVLADRQDLVGAS